MNKELLALLHRSFDGELSAQEQERLQKALEADPELRLEQRNFLEIEKLVSDKAERSFKPFFSARVMAKIKAGERKQQDFIASLLWSFRLVGAVALLAVLLLSAGNIVQGGSFSLNDVFAMPQSSIEETFELDLLLAEEP